MSDICELTEWYPFREEVPFIRNLVNASIYPYVVVFESDPLIEGQPNFYAKGFMNMDKVNKYIHGKEKKPTSDCRRVYRFLSTPALGREKSL